MQFPIGKEGSIFFYQRIIHKYILLINIYNMDFYMASDWFDSRGGSGWVSWRQQNTIDETHNDWCFCHEMRDDDSINIQPNYSLDPI